MNFKIVFSILLFSTLVHSQESSDDLRFYDDFNQISEYNIFKTEGYYNWGTSIIKGDDGQYHMFYSRWKKAYKFTGWLTHSEVAHATSKSYAGPWKFKEVVLKGRRNRIQPRQLENIAFKSTDWGSGLKFYKWSMEKIGQTHHRTFWSNHHSYR